MGRIVSQSINCFYRELRSEYELEGEASFLYQYFWRESVITILEKYCPQIKLNRAPQLKDEPKLREVLKKTVCERPELADAQLGSKEKQGDFWEELWLCDAGWQAGLITDSAYYLWLAEYLADHAIFYKDTSMWDGRQWLGTLLEKGLDWTEGARRPGWRALKTGDQKDKMIFRSVQVEEDLKTLAAEIRHNRDKIASQLHSLEEDGEDYLPWLTARLEKMALHVKIKNWLQYSGYPLVKGENKAHRKKNVKGPRKKDFSMQLLGAYLDSGKTGWFHGVDQKIEARGKGWRLDCNGFCVLDADLDQLKEFLEAQAVKPNEAPHLYLPLAVHLHSGCVFFLAGKGAYVEVYQNESKKKQDAYKDASAHYCFDYLRLVKQHSTKFPGTEVFCLNPVFHENAERSCEAVLDEFKEYCVDREGDSPLCAVMEYNREEPDGIPQSVRWAFEAREELEPPAKLTPTIKAAFQRDQNKAQRFLLNPYGL